MASGLPAVKVPKTEHPCLSLSSSALSYVMNTSSARTSSCALWTACAGKTVLKEASEASPKQTSLKKLVIKACFLLNEKYLGDQRFLPSSPLFK